MSGRFIHTVREQLTLLVAEAAVAAGRDPATAGLLVALSGGADSVALLDVAHHWCRDTGRPLVAVHYNHRLRGQASQRDEDFCRQLCRSLGTVQVVGAGDVRGLARARGRGFEDAARVLRLAYLETIRGEHDLAAIATGHHRDDQTETVILRLFRGTGLDGLVGMAPRHGAVIHPLLGCRRAEILAHLAGAGLSWREDATNLDGSNRRSRVRHELLPLVRDIFGPGADEPPARLADLAAADLAYLRAQTADAWDRLLVATPEGHEGPALSAAGLAALPTAIGRRVVRRWLLHHLPQDLALAHVDDVHRWAAHGRSGGGLDLPGGLRVVRIFDALAVSGTLPPTTAVDLWRLRVEALDRAPDPVTPPEGDRDDGWRLICAADALRGNLRLRHPREGDRLEPFGLGGSKKLSDLAREQRIPATLRPHLLVVEDDEGPLWVVGVAQAERTRLLPTTRQAVTIWVTRRRHERRR
ncbi:MAG: tRNA lysidine(34) synthetase TilS [Candidatus Krumholzibacteriia bacterium]